MNKRLQELGGDANDYADEFWERKCPEWHQFYTEKFARLILTEVTDILSTYRGKIIFVDGFEYNCDHPIVAIRKHFGVEL
jgi:hypothetical protein